MTKTYKLRPRFSFFERNSIKMNDTQFRKINCLIYLNNNGLYVYEKIDATRNNSWFGFLKNFRNTFFQRNFEFSLLHSPESAKIKKCNFYIIKYWIIMIERVMLDILSVFSLINECSFDKLHLLPLWTWAFYTPLHSTI